MVPLWQPYLSFWRQYRVAILALVAIAAVSVAGLYARGRPLDLHLFRAVNTGLADPALDVLGTVGYVLGAIWFSPGLVAALFLLGYRRFALSAVGALAVGALLILLLKTLTHEARPAQQIPGVRQVGLYELGLAFPSGHASQAFLTAYLLAAYFAPPGYTQAGLYALASFIALSRVYVGEHFPSDIISGALIGLILALAWVRSRLWPGPRADGPGAP